MHVCLPVCGAPCRLVSAITPLCYVAISFHRQVWYHAFSLRYVCIRSTGIIPQATSVPNFISFVASIAELAHGENRVLNRSLNDPAYVMHREIKRLLLLRCLHFRKPNQFSLVTFDTCSHKTNQVYYSTKRAVIPQHVQNAHIHSRKRPVGSHI